MTQPTRTTLSLNCRGLKSNNRLDHCISGLDRIKPDVVLLQETGLHRSDERRIHAIARRYGYLAAVGFISDTTSSGGTAVLIRWESFGMGKFEELAHQTKLGGGVTVVTIAKESFASVYVPVQAPLRATFLRRLRALHVIKRNTVVGADRNSVADVGLDVRYPARTNSRYANQHASLWDGLCSAVGLGDVFRMVEGKRARAYTRLARSVHTRIDCIFAPPNDQSRMWCKITFRDLSHASWSSDHLAVIAVQTTGAQEVDMGKGRPRIRPEIFDDPQVIDTLADYYSQTKKAYPPAEYGYKVWWRKWAASASQLMHKLSADHARSCAFADIAQLQKGVAYAQAQTLDPSPALQQRLRAHRTSHRNRPRRRATRQSAFRRTLFEEISTKEFYRRFKAKGVKQPITELFQTGDDGLPSTSSSTCSSSSDIVSHLTKYYAKLMGPKVSEEEARETLLDKLREKPLDKKLTKSIEGEITRDEVFNSICSLAPRKASGPDGIPPEYFRAFAATLAPDLAHMYNECLDDRQLTPSMLLGEITLLYKKKDPRDARNYRPITLLNLDYKIYAKILVSRMKRVIDTVIGEPQTGFVPGRVISWNTHLLNLIQAYLDETDETGLFIFLDCEKAFDRCSWPFLRQAASAIGFGPTICRWINTMYDDCAPPHRRITANGHQGEYFPLQSGVAQGCPASPILFLLITEGLTRMVLAEDSKIEGIKIRGREFRISQFADDTVFLLRSHTSIKHMWDVISLWERATGMMVNVDKTEGLRLGALQRPSLDHLFTSRVSARTSVMRGGAVRLHAKVPPGFAVKWCQPGDYLLSLGAPIGWGFSMKDFWRGKYFKCKALMSRWKDVARMSPLGSSMVANSMVFSRFRYWTYTSIMDKEISEAVKSDVQAVIWSKDADFDAESMGEDKVYRFVKERAQYNPRREGGVACMPWDAHRQAIAAQAILHYNNGWDLGWKHVLDHWFDKFQEGRGATLSTVPLADMYASPITGKTSRLPAFWRFALKAVRSLPMEPVSPSFISTDEAKAEPAFTSPRVTLTDTSFADTWRYDLSFNRLQDMIHPTTNKLYSDQKIREYIEQHLDTDGGFVTAHAYTDLDGRKRHTRIPVAKLVKQWRRFASDIGETALAQAAGTPQPTTRYLYSEQSKGMMEKMGWTPGEGLGRRRDGNVDPISLPGQVGKKGLGSGRNKGRSAGPPETKECKVFGYEVEPGVIKYGYPGERNGQKVLQLIQVSGRGRLVRTGVVIPCDDSCRRAVLWDGAPTGIADTTFPHPKGWRVRGTPLGRTLERLTVRELTAALRSQFAQAPSCEEAWRKKLGIEINFTEVWNRFCTPVITPRDGKNYFRFLHRSMLTRNLKPSVQGDDPEVCRMCASTREHFSHIHECSEMKQVFTHFAALATAAGFRCSATQELIVLGMFGGQPLPPGLSALHIILWKFAIIAFVQADEKRAAFVPADIWKAALRRLRSRMLSHEEAQRRRAAANRSRGVMSTSSVTASNQLVPLAHYEDDTLEVCYHTELQRRLVDC